MKFRKILAMVMALALLCATFAACGDTSGTSSSAGTSSAASDSGDSSAAEEGETTTGGSGGTLNMRNTMEPTSLNTLLATYAYDFTPINAMIECLCRDDENDVPQPAGAETVDISDDKLVYTFHLREDAPTTSWCTPSTCGRTPLGPTATPWLPPTTSSPGSRP